MSVTTDKTYCCWNCFCISSASRYLQLCKRFFVGSNKKCTLASWHHHYYTFLCCLGVRVYLDIFHDIILCYSLTTTWTLTFGYIKRTPYVDFTCSFLDIVFCQYSRQDTGKKLPQKFGMSISSIFFARKLFPWCPVHFLKKYNLECEIKVTLGWYSAFYWHHV